jgi:hypothetical protein
MNKYSIEGNIDFYDELYKSLDIEENTHKTEEDLSLCLITKETLVDKHFTMECGHKFNYIPLFNDIKNHKQKFNGFEVAKCQLKQDEIRCPYCRNKQKGLLPYYEDLLLEKINGVNYICENKNDKEKLNLCQFLLKKSDVNDSEDQELVKCCKIGNKIPFSALKTQTYPFNQTSIEIIDNNNYCYKHRNHMIKEYKKCIINNMKQELKIKKLNEKADLKIAKIGVKQKKDFTNIFSNMIMDSSGNNHTYDSSGNYHTYDSSGNNHTYDSSGNNHLSDLTIGNILNINSVTNNILKNKCIEIIKTGKNKGTSCGCKIVSDNLCKRHYNLKNKTTNIITI